ncbi:hypothetical protein 1 [Culex tritaeniorhynchus Anphevirus]|uniref:Uncharacterized protein n=1 Tax=Culex tritaeniorhynchus Anphevirus TaxID=2684266 RepID=A0A6F8PYS1_9MONO|nr:hypothetical protein 1 [Culex tritaeniorhynchus Anphevirus]BBQ04813.1 hypothetical protein 1 [Culex tritaeniorhynchus Anphevirus]BBQ04818.1 hypothetical protein 1 [Culex tritaeniorhynchus Anphevirus]BDV27050.1 hypothetical protein [Culex tritaeniorhynchus Anphevirus]
MEIPQLSLRAYPDEVELLDDGKSPTDGFKKTQTICIGPNGLLAVTAYVKLVPIPDGVQEASSAELRGKHPDPCWRLKDDGVMYLAFQMKVQIHKSGDQLMRKAFNKEGFVPYTITVCSKPPARSVLINADILEEGANAILPYFNALTTIISADKVHLTAIIIPFASIPNFKTYLAAYTEDPDDAVIIQRNEDEAKALLSPVSELYGCKQEAASVLFRDRGEAVKDPYRSASEQMCYCYMLAFCIVKSGTSENVKSALKKRLDAYSNVIRDPNFEVDKFITNFYNAEAMNIIARQLNHYPKLKSAIYSAVINSDSTSCAHFKSILEGSQLTKFNFMYAFLFSPPSVTALHFCSDVTRYYAKFIDVYHKLVAKYGSMWQYHKLICPDEPLTTLSQFGRLVQAGLAFAASRPGNQDRIRNVQGYKDVPACYFVMVTKEVGTADGTTAASYEEVLELLKSINGQFNLSPEFQEVNLIAETVRTSNAPDKIAAARMQFRLDE